MTFEEWFKKVDDELQIMTMGAASVHDIADWHYRDAYDDGIPPKEAAEEALLADDLGRIFFGEMFGG